MPGAIAKLPVKRHADEALRKGYLNVLPNSANRVGQGGVAYGIEAIDLDHDGVTWHIIEVRHAAQYRTIHVLARPGFAADHTRTTLPLQLGQMFTELTDAADFHQIDGEVLGLAVRLDRPVGAPRLGHD